MKFCYYETLSSQPHKEQYCQLTQFRAEKQNQNKIKYNMVSLLLFSFFSSPSLLSKSNLKPWLSINLSQQENSMPWCGKVRQTLRAARTRRAGLLCSLYGRGLIVCSPAPFRASPRPQREQLDCFTSYQLQPQNAHNLQNRGQRIK